MSTEVPTTDVTTAARRPEGRHRSGTDAAARGILVSSLRDRRVQVRGLAGWSVVEAVPDLLSGLLVARAVDDGFLAGRPVNGFAWLGVLGLSVLLGAWGTRQAMRRLAEVVEPFRDELVTRVVTSAVRRSTVSGSSPATADVARVTSQVEILREAYASILTVVQQFLVVTVSALIGLLTLAPAVLPLVLPPLLISLLLFAASILWMAKQQRASIMSDERLSEDATTVSAGLRDIAACGGQDTVRSTVGRHIDDHAVATAALGRLTGVGTVAVALGGWLPLLFILAAGSWLIEGGATPGVILGAVTYVLSGLTPALTALVSGISGPGLWLMVTLRRIVEATDPAPEGGVDDDPAAEEHEGVYCLQARAATFAYSPWAAPVVRALDLVVPGGDHLAIVGPSGIGKSTLAGLLAGLLEPQAGEIRLGGVRMRELPAPELAGLRVLIPQEAYVFSGTLRENVNYLRADTPDAELDLAVDRLGARRLVERLGGYDAEIDPATLSAGERQLITLVRAYVSPAAVVILDEASCHLDPAAEAQVELAFADRPGSLVVIAHRMSSALRARRILVLDGTQAVLGDHEDLLWRSPLYRDLIGHWQGGNALSTRPGS